MADSAVQITEGVGTFVDTRTDTDGEHRQVVVVGDPAVNNGVAPVDGTSGLKVNLGVDNDVTVSSGAITTTMVAGDKIVLDSIDSNTAYGALVGGGTETGALRVTIANNSTGVLSIDDNGQSITVDGTVTTTMGAADRAVLDDIAANTDYGVVVGGGSETGALRVTLANNSTGVLTVDDGGQSLTVDGPALDLIDNNTRPITDELAGQWETVPAGANDQILGGTGASGDWLRGVLIVPGTTSPGAVSIKDGAGSPITVFTGGTDSVSNLVPFMVPLGMYSNTGAWQVSTGANVTAIGVGRFT